MASKASSGFGYQPPKAFASTGIGMLTGVIGIWMPVIGLPMGFSGMDVLTNPVWGLAYNLMSGAINITLGATPGTLGGILQLFLGALAWPLFVCVAVTYALAGCQNWHSGWRKRVVLVLFSLTLLMNIPASWFTSNGPACGFFLYPAMIY